MTTATYRGVSYNVEDRQLNELSLIKAKLEKVQAKKEAEKVNIRQSHRS